MKIETDLMETVCRATDAMKCWLEHREHFIPVIEDELMQNAYCTWASDKLYIQASGDKEQLTTLFRVLAKNGFHLPGEYRRPEDKQPEWSGLFRKSWTDAGGVDWFFEIYVSFCSTVCQKIQVGTELREIPVYEIVCGDRAQDSVTIQDDIPF
jgi:hypothetical protein